MQTNHLIYMQWRQKQFMISNNQAFGSLLSLWKSWHETSTRFFVESSSEPFDSLSVGEMSPGNVGWNFQNDIMFDLQVNNRLFLILLVFFLLLLLLLLFVVCCLLFVVCCLLLVLGSWFLVPGSWFLVFGSWFKFLVLGSWFLDLGCCWLLLVVVGCWLLVVGCWLVAVGCWFVVGGCRRLIVDCWLLGWLLVVVHIPVPWSQTLPAKTQHVALFNAHWFSPTSMTLSGYCSALGWWRLITVHTRFPNKLEAYDGYVCVYIYICMY